MRMKKVFGCILVSVLFSACTTEVQKKVLVMGQGDLNVNGKVISMLKGSGHAEKEVAINEEGAIDLTVTTAAGKQTYSLPADKGYYILNLKTDTLVGSRQLIGRDLTNTKVMTQEELKVKIDSLVSMTQGSNIDNSNNFIVLPNKPLMVSADLNARIYGPFRKIPSKIDATSDNKEPELYKFYTNTEVRDLIKNLRELTF
jgi:hypothetical protein